MLTPLSTAARLDNISVGDTFYYNVTEFNLPLEDIASVIPDAEPDLVSYLGDIQLDFTDSTFAVKIMDKHESDGTYLLNAFLILGRDIVFPFPSFLMIPDEIYDIFGTEVGIPAGIGLGIGLNVPGDDLQDFLPAGTTEPEGLPYYVEPTKFGELKTFLDDQAASDPTSIVTITEGDLFIIDISIEEPESNITLQVIVEWFQTGGNAGVFKGIDFDFDVVVQFAITCQNRCITGEGLMRAFIQINNRQPAMK